MRDLFYCVEAGRTEGRHRSIVEIAHERHPGSDTSQDEGAKGTTHLEGTARGRTTHYL